MTGPAWLVTALLLGAATAVAWPARAVRTRRRAVLDAAPGPGAAPVALRTPADAPPGCRAAPTRGRHDGQSTLERPSPTRPPNRRDAAHPSAALRLDVASGSPAAARSLRSSLDAPASTGVAGLPPRRLLLAAIVLGGGTGAVLGGPVGGVVLAAYGALGARAVRRRHARRSAEQARRRELDQLCTLAADLRAGLPVTLAPVDGPDRVARLARAAVRLADRTGAPLADLLERVEADARANDRGLAAADAQAAGARATAWLLAALPLGGIGLGYAIGVDPVAVLLHTPVGGGSAIGAVALQISGLLWAERLGAAPGRAD
ncbi:type II secretion system F family protein [Micromonospora sp. NPDC048930]|uniref:type II secretion system F family protein n=1 Tax=Micromonospora sp. NPDC048930 TaxID=3364261 RepID=UPI00371EFD3C